MEVSMKTLIVSTFLLLSAAVAQACPDLSGVYRSGGVKLTINQTACDNIKTHIYDELEGGGLTAEFFPGQGGYADPRFARGHEAVRVDSFSNGQLVSLTNLVEFGRAKALKKVMQLVGNNIVISEFEMNYGVWSSTSTMNFKKQ